MSPDLLRDGSDCAGSSPGLRGILDALRGRGQPAAADWPLPEPMDVVRQVSAHEDLRERFTRAASAAGTQVHRAGVAEWTGPVMSVLRGCGARRIFVGGQPDGYLTRERLGELANALAAAGVQPTAAADADTLFAVDAAITGAAAAIAETGTIVCTSGPGRLRGSSLIAPVHVAMVGVDQLLPDLYDYLGYLGPQELPAQLVLISGPSKTSDIEGVLVTGMHGPGEFHVILVEP